MACLLKRSSGQGGLFSPVLQIMVKPMILDMTSTLPTHVQYSHWVRSLCSCVISKKTEKPWVATLA